MHPIHQAQQVSLEKACNKWYLEMMCYLNTNQCLTINGSLTHVGVLCCITLVADRPKNGCIIHQHIDAPVLLKDILGKFVYSGHVAEVYGPHINMLGALLFANLCNL